MHVTIDWCSSKHFIPCEPGLAYSKVSRWDSKTEMMFEMHLLKIIKRSVFQQDFLLVFLMFTLIPHLPSRQHKNSHSFLASKMFILSSTNVIKKRKEFFWFFTQRKNVSHSCRICLLSRPSLIATPPPSIHMSEKSKLWKSTCWETRDGYQGNDS